MSKAISRQEVIRMLLAKQAEGESKLSALRDEIEDSLDRIYQDFISAEGAILDILGVPKDNTVETNCCEIATETGQWPEWGYCRDWAYELYGQFITQRRDVDGFIQAIESTLEGRQ
jgi:hypothetical protein